MPRIDLSSAGVKFKYAVEATAGTRPTADSAYTALTGVNAIPDLNPEPSSLQTTTLDEEEYHTYIPGLKDTGGAMSIGANNSEQFQTDWAAMVTACTAANADGKSMWFAVVIPGLTKAFYFSGVPSPLGLSAIEVDQVLSINGYITPSKIAGWDTKPTA